MTQTYFSPATLSLDLTLSGADLVITTAPNRSSNVSGCLSYNQLPASTKTYFEITHTSGTSGSDSGIGAGEASATYYGLGNNGTSGAIIFSTGSSRTICWAIV